MNESAKQLNAEPPAEKAKRLTDALGGLLKEELAAYGGVDAYMRWIRGLGDGEDDPWVLYGIHRIRPSSESETNNRE